MDNGASSYRRYLKGDDDAFREIVNAYFDNLVFFIDRFVHDYAASEDIALDVFTCLVVNKGHYHFGVSLKTYLFMLGRSRALDYIRRRSKLSMEPLSEADQLPSGDPTPEELVLADERRRTVNRALAQLDESLHLAVHLVYFEQLSAREAGKVLRKTEKQIYNLLYRAKQRLRSILKEEGDDFYA